MENKSVDIYGWKGKDEIEVIANLEGYIVREHRKNKETGEVDTKEIKVSMENYNFMLGIIKELEFNYQVGYVYIIRKIIARKDLNVSIDAFNGGKNRAKFYFPLYYYPIKVLEAQKKIAYFGRGGVMRLN